MKCSKCNAASWQLVRSAFAAHPEATLCAWRDIKMQGLSNCLYWNLYHVTFEVCHILIRIHPVVLPPDACLTESIALGYVSVCVCVCVYACNTSSALTLWCFLYIASKETAMLCDSFISASEHVDDLSCQRSWGSGSGHCLWLCLFSGNGLGILCMSWFFLIVIVIERGKNSTLEESKLYLATLTTRLTVETIHA